MKIVIADPSLLPHRALLEGGLPEGSTTSWYDSANEHALMADLADADVLVSARLTKAMGSVASRLRLVHAPGAGYDGIDLDALPEGAVVANTFNHEESIAEYVAASLVILRRRLLCQDRSLRQGRWASAAYDRSIPQPSTLRGSVVTFLGFGHIGTATWQLLRAFGCEGIAITRSGSADTSEHGLRWSGTVDELERALEQSDVLVVSIPLGPETTGLIADGELDALGADGLLVNVARGPVVEETALYDALSEGRIAGAAIDVWYRYPGSDGEGSPSALPFDDLDNVLLTPHSSGVTADTFRGRALDIAENISRLANSEPLKNVVASR
ncbi:2-hydroxyacid dehydrogenase [Agreia bicolorata]|uniref:2-hydroxyacid dehydrogenase n=1 Tax=Agreia bicolorata TaxID=110935 RepID=A0ABR5CI18_9MICO|nr:2-hydroxyacid dehydrogenase [Agreia bicolorata]KJC65230.1 2-hydroxyacid dehydrogenase [Agreia bicolorata]